MKTHYLSIFLIALTTLAYQVLLTRIFSVTMWYHYAFMAISIAMFGMTLGALIVYLRPQFFDPDRVVTRIISGSIWFSISIVCSFIFFLGIPVVNLLEITTVPLRVILLAVTYFVISIPFIFSGVLITLYLTQFKQYVSRLYAADLIGAAGGTLAIVFLLSVVTAPSGVFILAALAALPAVLLLDVKSSDKRILGAFLVGCFVSVGLVNNHLAKNNNAPVTLVFVKGGIEQSEILFERWNSHSRVTVSEFPTDQPFGWGFSPTLPGDISVEQKMLTIDAGAGTVLTKYNGDIKSVDYLKYDISNLPHYVRKDADIMVIGAGGGRDVLSSFVFEQNSVTAAEVNSAIVEVTTDVFADYIGNIMSDPRVTIVHDEARSYLSRTAEQFDIIQISLIDTWAATAAGAFVLSENSLYTTEAWNIFFDKLKPGGVLSVSRWYYSADPAEMYRTASLAAETLRSRGISEPGKHIVIYRAGYSSSTLGQSPGIATLLVSPDPFTAEDIANLKNVADTYEFEEILTPDNQEDQIFAVLTSSETPTEFLNSYVVDVTPPNDNKPFFFNMLRPRDFLKSFEWQYSPNSFNMKAVSTLISLLGITIVFAVVFILYPLLLRLRHSINFNTAPYILFFVSIGFGFMLIEVALLQRLSSYLGHPIYGLTIVLFSLLLAGGVGSYLTSKVKNESLLLYAKRYMSSIIIVTSVVTLLLPSIVGNLIGVEQPVRIAVAVMTVTAAGIFMGTAFPLGMRLAQRQIPEITPFLWGINGATSVVASVLAVVISMIAGIATTLLVGVAVYALALVSLFMMKR